MFQKLCTMLGPQWEIDRPFLSCLEPRYESEVKCQVFFFITGLNTSHWHEPNRREFTSGALLVPDAHSNMKSLSFENSCSVHSVSPKPFRVTVPKTNKRGCPRKSQQMVSLSTCSAATDSTGNPICFVQVSMTAATGLELA